MDALKLPASTDATHGTWCSCKCDALKSGGVPSCRPYETSERPALPFRWMVALNGWSWRLPNPKSAFSSTWRAMASARCPEACLSGTRTPSSCLNLTTDAEMGQYGIMDAWQHEDRFCHVFEPSSPTRSACVVFVPSCGARAASGCPLAHSQR